MKRCFKCVSNQKCSTGNLQSLWGRCEMCSPCHFCYDRSTLHAPRCQIPPPSHYCSSNALDSSVRKSRETLVPWPASGQLPDHGKDSETKRQFTFITKEKLLIYGPAMCKVNFGWGEKHSVSWRKANKKDGISKLPGWIIYSVVKVDTVMGCVGLLFYNSSVFWESNLLLISSRSLLRLPRHHSCWVDCLCVWVFVSAQAEPWVTLSSEVLI